MLTSVELAHTIGVTSISVLADIYTTRVTALSIRFLGHSYSLNSRITSVIRVFCIIINPTEMNYFIIADRDVHKYDIYHIQNDKEFYSEAFYHAFRKYLSDKTGHDVRGDVQTNALENTSFTNADEKDFVYFDAHMREFKQNYYK